MHLLSCCIQSIQFRFIRNAWRGGEEGEEGGIHGPPGPGPGARRRAGAHAVDAARRAAVRPGAPPLAGVAAGTFCLFKKQQRKIVNNRNKQYMTITS